MHVKMLAGRLIAFALAGAPFFLSQKTISDPPERLTVNLSGFNAPEGEEDEEEEEEHKGEFTRQRLLHEYKMLRNPITGRIPENYRRLELQAAARIPSRNASRYPWLNGIYGTEGTTTNNNYVSVGPNNVAGRSRTLAWDSRNTNIMLTGGTTGGIFRSTDGGASWTFVSPEDDIRSVTSIVQDPTAPDTWYCGTGEVYYPTSSADIAGTFGHGIFKSTNNGTSWTKLAVTVANNNPNRFDVNFDLVHRMAVHPTTGHVYAAVHNRLLRSTDKGATWTTVLGGGTANNVFGGITEVFIPANGSRIFAAFSGGGPDADNVNRDRAAAGVWQSTTGASGAWTRIAGGVLGQPDSVAGWRGYGRWGRIVLTTSADAAQLFVLYKNGEDAEAGDPEADLFRANLNASLPGNAAWTNLSAWVPNEPGTDISGIDPYTTQFEGFNMSIKVKPDNNNILFIGGTCLHRVNLSETDPARKFRRAGGYGGGFFPNLQSASPYPDHHPDVHYINYAPGNNNTVYTASDGGIHKSSTTDIADTIRWTPLTAELQTLQFQGIGIIPDLEASWIIGGAQDNGTQVNLDAPAAREHIQIGSGDGAAAALSDFTKTGNDWKQYWYFSTSNGNIFRSNFDWQLVNNTLNYVNNTNSDITPNGRSNEGQWLTLFALDPDSTQKLYYTSNNRLYRTTAAQTVNTNSWTEITGVRNTIASGEVVSAMALSKLPGRTTVPNKRLFMGTDGGKVYRMDSADVKGPATRPVDITPSSMVSGSYVSGIAVNPRNPDTVLVTVSNYDADGSTVHNIYFSGNATAAVPIWQTIDGALEPASAQSCAIVVTTAGVEYYVGTSIGLYSSTSINGESTTWASEGSGMLKTAIIRSMTVRPEDNTMVIGTHGNGAFYSEIGRAISYDGSVPPTDPEPSGSFISGVRNNLYRNGTNVDYYIGTGSFNRISVQLFNSIGQLLYKEERGYNNGSVNLDRYAAGVYFLRIISVDGSQKFVQKIVKP